MANGASDFFGAKNYKFEDFASVCYGHNFYGAVHPLGKFSTAASNRLYLGHLIETLYSCRWSY